ncbi:DMT family transporter [Chloroflexus sp.]|uniref:DMT family transporter n=1 Tax=Chloroflexus sp. TaxID=1904827 RepID=UPI00260E87D5|nr:DMT family transporter [uncultured Chloroflexus sp.]
MNRHRLWLYTVLFAGVMIASTASIMIRYAQSAGMSSLSIAAGRLGLAALILTPLALGRAGSEIRRLRRRDILFGIGSGAFLAVHFASWISSLEYTSVASSAALVSTNPLWVGLASLFFFRERLHWTTLLGIALTLIGTITIGISDSSNSTQSNPLLGNTLALVGAATASAYLLIGRDLRRRLSVLAYIWLVYTSAAVVLVIWALVAGQQFFGFPPYVYLFVLGLAIGPQLLGHTAFNYALSSLSATYVAVAILGEPIGSTLLAFLLFGETLAPLQFGGIVLLLGGIAIASIAEQRAPASASQQAVG